MRATVTLTSSTQRLVPGVSARRHQQCFVVGWAATLGDAVLPHVAMTVCKDVARLAATGAHDLADCKAVVRFMLKAVCLAEAPVSSEQTMQAQKVRESIARMGNVVCAMWDVTWSLHSDDSPGPELDPMYVATQCLSMARAREVMESSDSDALEERERQLDQLDTLISELKTHCGLLFDRLPMDDSEFSWQLDSPASRDAADGNAQGEETPAERQDRTLLSTIVQVLQGAPRKGRMQQAVLLRQLQARNVDLVFPASESSGTPRAVTAFGEVSKTKFATWLDSHSKLLKLEGSGTEKCVVLVDDGGGRRGRAAARSKKVAGLVRQRSVDSGMGDDEKDQVALDDISLTGREAPATSARFTLSSSVMSSLSAFDKELNQDVVSYIAVAADRVRQASAKKKPKKLAGSIRCLFYAHDLDASLRPLLGHWKRTAVVSIVTDLMGADNIIFVTLEAIRALAKFKSSRVVVPWLCFALSLDDTPPSPEDLKHAEEVAACFSDGPADLKLQMGLRALFGLADKGDTLETLLDSLGDSPKAPASKKLSNSLIKLSRHIGSMSMLSHVVERCGLSAAEQKRLKEQHGDYCSKADAAARRLSSAVQQEWAKSEASASASPLVATTTAVAEQHDAKDHSAAGGAGGPVAPARVQDTAASSELPPHIPQQLGASPMATGRRNASRESGKPPSGRKREIRDARVPSTPSPAVVGHSSGPEPYRPTVAEDWAYIDSELVELESAYREYKCPIGKTFKELSSSCLKVCSKVVPAFLNTSGGTLFIGIHDDRRVLGYDLSEKEIDLLSQRLSILFGQQVRQLQLSSQLLYPYELVLFDICACR